MSSKYRPQSRFVLIILLLNSCLFRISLSLNVSPGEKWQNGIVKYKIHSGLPLRDIAELRKAFNVYHTKTCIRFLPWQEGDVDFVSIEKSNKALESGMTCKVGGYQYARIGTLARNLADIVYILGFALCLGSEHKRVDRNEYLNFQEYCTTTPSVLRSHSPMGMYDYESIWHWNCNKCETGWAKISNVTKCGQRSNGSLSVLDVDGINSLYNCQGCNRHRWRPVENLTIEDMANMHSFGYQSHDGTPLFPCRARVATGSVIAGKYDDSKKSCRIYENFELYEETNNVEVLTIPRGLLDQCSKYKLVDKADATVANAIVAGGRNEDYGWKSHVAFASVNGTYDGVTEDSVGNVWKKDGAKLFDKSAEMPLGAAGVRAMEYQVLVCVKDTSCMLEELYVDQKRCT